MTKRLLVLSLLAAAVAAAAGRPATAASPSPSPSPTPTPNPYRKLDFASATLQNQPEGQIVVSGGFAAAKRDGKSVIACVSFKNVAPATATRVVFEFPLLGARGRELGTLHLDRHGEFSPNVDINGWSSLDAWQGGVGHRGYGDNCAQLQQGVASAPILQAAAVTYRVTRVEYADGTFWPH